MINIWIGYDDQFKENRLVQEKSILDKTKRYRVSINYLKLTDLKPILYRERCPKQSTDSAFTRWLVPHLQNYKGWALYMDSDMMVRKDLSDLWDMRDDTKTVQVVKHNSKYYQTTKFNNNIQIDYERKNWSSLILFNCEKCTALSLDYINTTPGLNLHKFSWTQDNEIGELPLEWNYLVGINKKLDAAIVHWTLGGPWFDEYSNSEYSKEWLKNQYLLS